MRNDLPYATHECRYCAFSLVMRVPDVIREFARASKAEVLGIITDGAAWMPGSRPGMTAGRVALQSMV